MTDEIINFTDPLKGSFSIKPYTSNGNRFPTSSTRNSTSVAADSVLLLYGKGHPEYGERTHENLLHLAENFSGASAPVLDSTGNSMSGVLWHREALYHRVGALDWREWNGTAWITPTVSEGLLAARAPTGANGALYYATDTLQLFRYSDDERGIQQWIERAFTTGALPGSPERELRINHDGTPTGWEVLPDSAALDLTYLLLDGTNSMSGNLQIVKTDPTMVLNGTTNWQVHGNGDILEFRIGGTPGTDVWLELDEGNGYITHGNNVTPAVYSANINGVNNAIPNIFYVDNVVAGAISGDRYVSGGSFVAGILTLPISIGSPSNVLVTGFDADQIPFTPFANIASTNVQDAIEELETEKASLAAGANFSGAVTFGGTIDVPSTSALDPGTTAASKDYVDAVTGGASPDALRYIENVSGAFGSPLIGSPAVYSLVLPFTYLAGNNRTMIFKNGVKLYNNLEGYQDALFSTPITSATSITGLNTLTDYTFRVNVDGGGIIGVGFGAVKINGGGVLSFGTLVPLINAAIDDSGVGPEAAECFIFNGNLRFRSLNTDADTSSIVVLDSTFPIIDLFGTVSGSPTTNLSADDFVGFGPSVAGVSYGYYESTSGSPFGVAPAGTATDSITITTPLLPTDVIETLVV